MLSTNFEIEIDSSKTGKTYNASKFREFDIDLNLETDADGFEIVLKNPHGIYTALFSKFDRFRLKLNKKIIMVGNLDCINYIWNNDDSMIKLSGRDLCSALIDNDAVPDTLVSVDPRRYITDKCAKYGINKTVIAQSDLYDSLVIGCSESEISIINNMLLENKQRFWYLIDIAYTGTWSMGASPIHTFVRGNNISGIPIESLSLKEDGSDMKSKIVIYGSTSDGTQKVFGEAVNNYMVNRGIEKVKIRRSYSDSASSKYNATALEDTRNFFRDNIILTIDVKLDSDHVFMPNSTARVVDSEYTNMDAIFFIKGVQYSKTITGGSLATLTMVPADVTFEKLWQSSTNSSVTNLTSQSRDLGGV